jgi:F-type H+-transporting ATPase subunit b
MRALATSLLAFAFASSIAFVASTSFAQPRFPTGTAVVANAENPEPKKEASEAEENAAPAPINWIDFSNKKQPPYAATLLNFAILIGIYVAFGKKPIAEALKMRRANVAKQIEEAQRMKAEAEERAKIYQAKLEHLEEELAATRAALVEAGKGDRDRIVREAEEKADRLERDATFLIEQEMKQLRQDLMRSTVEIAVQAAEELLKKRVTPADQERLADEYLAELTHKASPRPSMAPKSAPPAAGGAS